MTTEPTTTEPTTTTTATTTTMTTEPTTTEPTTTTTATTTTTISPPSHPSCFPSVSRVKLENGKFKPMSELQMGDKVQTGTSLAGMISIFTSVSKCFN